MDVDSDNKRHKREEEDRRKKRHEKRAHKSKEQLDRERKRKEHAQRVLNEQNKKLKAERDGSKFQALFTKRAEGFLIDMNFRNAAPRPPVGPCFVGLGLDGELNDKWTRYKPFNAVEANYAWKLHAEPDLGVPLAPSAMDLEGCYVDPTKKSKKSKNDGYDELFDDDETDEKQNGHSGENKGPEALHPDDEALINWKGHPGDSAADELKATRAKAIAEARLGITGGKALASASNHGGNQISRAGRSSGVPKSRVLKEEKPWFMVKTTYLDNDKSRSVHKFKSLAETKAQNAEVISGKLKNDVNVSNRGNIDKSFDIASKATGKRKHPAKKDVEAVLEIPLLPDDITWGHTFTHVVLDKLPNVNTKRSKISFKQLENAFIGDVEKAAKNDRMECNFLVTDDETTGIDSSSPSTSKTAYGSIQRYDLDIQPLKEEGAPHSNFLFIVDEESGIANYHPLASRVQLSSGRPGNQAAGVRIITKRELDEDDLQLMEKRLKELNADNIDAGSSDESGTEDVANQNSNKRHNPFAVEGDSSDSDDGF
uniref:Uncharacterized protein n=2 Tax=Chaetoceros debilis TaxID=122233 RepID=A0A7S3V444_9STRA|mmetsp:Transcript_22152/g.33721  ORF Transcript_22152/g.33721 Transcript_22152/m.33721 type:complete len:540 (-) Transcript_22152:143-1762(-)|eukprot:CAMPEP_0194083038 /NCGR_PEP_ID=MMETSP0149-20130528/8392_1 /TAXON_ID=122233 /ORGANISM="Chaetoceros debilis, Strain MM31A-1" /LENGTH=539 /DNA_ID=CAMNT_0038765337 /DNA_START=76 /DNA_END=1695 /DNA_ORIENTATION=-